MKKKIIDFVEEYLSLAHCKVEKGHTCRTYRIQFNSMISCLHLNQLIAFCHSNKYNYYVSSSIDATNKVEFVIYK